jgi:hypothetical protein
MFTNTLKTNKGFEALRDMIIKSENLNKLLITDFRGNIRFGLLLDYRPHFKTEVKLSVTDFPNDRVIIVHPDYGPTVVQSDALLHSIIKEQGGKLVPIHVPGGNPGDIILTPAGLLNRLFKTTPARYELGFRDIEGNVHTGYFLCDDLGNKLISKLKLTKNGLSDRGNPNWANNIFQYELVYDGELDSFIYQSNFYSAYTIRTGKVVHSNLQDTFLNLDHIDPVKEPLPNLESNRARKRKVEDQVILRAKLDPEIDKKAYELATVLNQLGGLFTLQRAQDSKVLISSSFLNLHTEGYHYSTSLFKKILASLKPRSGDAIYGDGSIVNPAKSNYWVKQITRGQEDSTGEFAQTPLQNLETFYKAWYDLIQNHLSKGESEFISKELSLTLKKLLFAASENVYKFIDYALEEMFGYTGFMSLLAGIMTFSESSEVSGGYRIDFWLHTEAVQRDLLNKFVGRSLHDPNSGDLGKKFLSDNIAYSYFASIFLFGAKRGDRLIRPSNSFFLDGYYSKHILLKNSHYSSAIEKFLYRSFSEFLEVQKLNEMSLKGRLEIIDFLVKKLTIALETATLPQGSSFQTIKELFINMLITRIISPSSNMPSYNPVVNLRQIYFTGSSNTITLTLAGGRVSDGGLGQIQISFEVTKEELDGIITPNQIQTMNFDSIKEGYYLDFDLVWPNLAPKVQEAYTLLKEMFEKAPISPDQQLTVKFYQRRPVGIKLITEKDHYYQLKPASFSQSEFFINPNNQEDLETKVLSMLFWMVMEPNIIPVVKLPNGNNFLIMDIFELHDTNRYLGTLTGDYAPPSGFEQDRAQFSKIFSHSDLMDFVNFHNHELSDTHGDMISYVMAKFIIHYVSFLKGKQNSKLFDLR